MSIWTKGKHQYMFEAYKGSSFAKNLSKKGDLPKGKNLSERARRHALRLKQHEMILGPGLINLAQHKFNPTPIVTNKQ